MAVDPQDDSKLYLALGEYTNRSVTIMSRFQEASSLQG